MPLAPRGGGGLLAGVDSPLLRFAFKPYRRPFRVPVRTSRGLWTVREGILVRLDRADGRSGFGEIAPLESFGTESFAGALAWCAGIASQPDAAGLRESAAGSRGTPCCAAAITAALEALEETPPSAGAAERSLPVACLLPTGAVALDAAARAADRGFATLKLKIGAADFAAESKLVNRLAERMPPGAKLRLDANGGLDCRTAARWLAAAQDWPVEFVEQPLPPEAGHDLLALANDHATPLALDESARTADDVKRWRDRGWRGVFVIKPALAGVPDALLGEIAIEPEAFVFSSALETDVGLAAGLRLAFAAGITRALGFGVGGFFPDDGLGGGVDRPRLSAADALALRPEDAWNRL